MAAISSNHPKFKLLQSVTVPGSPPAVTYRLFGQKSEDYLKKSIILVSYYLFLGTDLWSLGGWFACSHI